MEKIGLSFRVPNTYGKLLFNLLGNLLENPYVWKKGNHTEVLFTDNFDSELEYIHGLNILSNIQMKKYVSFGNYYPIMATFYGYLTNEEIESSISNGSEFLNSSCNIFISIVDSSEVIFLSKDISIIEDIEEKYHQYNFSNLRYIDIEDCLSLNFD